MARTAGVVKVLLDGIDYGTKSATYRMGGKTKTSQFASGKRTGSSEQPNAGHIEVVYEHLSTTDFATLREWEGTATVIFDTGDVHTVANAEVMDSVELQGQGNGIRLMIEGDPGQPG